MTPLPSARREQQVTLRQVALRAGRGQSEALTELVRQTSRQVWWVCAAVVDVGSADDLTQETYLRAVRSLPGYRGESDPLRWLLTIARRVCAAEIADRQRARRVAAWLHVECPPMSLDPLFGVDVQDAVARLGPDRREAFLLTAVAGFTYAEVAAICGCPIGTVRSRVARARTELIEALDLPGGEADRQITAGTAGDRLGPAVPIHPLLTAGQR